MKLDRPLYLERRYFRRVASSIIGKGGPYSYIRVLHYSFRLKSIVFTVCEHKYMNKGPPPIIELATLLRYLFVCFFQ